ncbi:putative PIN_12 domain-containing protein [Brevibacillus sp. IT-7CA2]|uniref:PIN domain-containing protein n=1 Tax=Brevibacillus sp. IT-7CA2 TaxID=3026436 RepID=UPI0039E12130
MFKKRYMVILDTNILINLCEPDSPETRYYKHLFLKANIEVVLPQRVVLEWKRLYEVRNETFFERIINPVESGKKLLPLFRNANAEEAKCFTDALEKLIKMRKREYRYTSGRKFEQINDLIDSKLINQTGGISLASKGIIADMAINRERPFFCNTNPTVKQAHAQKNEADDAEVFFSAIEFVKEALQYNSFEKIFFVTNNTNEFSSFDNKTKIHENLLPYTEELGITYSINLKEVIKEISPEIEDIAGDEMAEANDYLQDNYFIDCPVVDCEGEIQKNVDGYHGKYGYWYYRCPLCKHEWNSGDHYHDLYN